MWFCHISSKNVYNFGSLKLYIEDLGIIPETPEKQMIHGISLWSLVLLKPKTFRTSSIFFKDFFPYLVEKTMASFGKLKALLANGIIVD